MKLLVLAAAASLAAGVYGTASTPTAEAASAAMPALYKNCTNVNKKYPHGIGRANARDRVRGDTEPVTTFKRSTRLYTVAMGHNRGLDRDKDGIACEKL